MADERKCGTPNLPTTPTSNSLAAFIDCTRGSLRWKSDLDETCDVSSTQDLVPPNINLVGPGPPVNASLSQQLQMQSASFVHASVDLQ
ncbi:MAG TPA: hypothetical protein PKC03_00380 [Dokdonella sp.]|jgi:hypothetical protein|nr:hypothetical protein [Dokdonella sp.]